MNLKVECHAGRKADERPTRFWLDGKPYAVEAILDQWYDPESIFVKLRADDGNLYILRQSTTKEDGQWDLVSFRQNKRRQTLSGLGYPKLARMRCLRQRGGRKYTIHTSANIERSIDQKMVAKVMVTCEVSVFGQNGNDSTGGGDVVYEIEQMERVVGKRMYRGLVKSAARLWNPEDIKDLAIQEKVLTHARGGTRIASPRSSER